MLENKSDYVNMSVPNWMLFIHSNTFDNNEAWNSGAVAGAIILGPVSIFKNR